MIRKFYEGDVMSDRSYGGGNPEPISSINPILAISSFVYSPNTVQYRAFRNDVFYYEVREKHTNDLYEFPIHMSEVKGVTLEREDKAMYYMRWIRLAIERGQMIKKADGIEAANLMIKGDK